MAGADANDLCPTQSTDQRVGDQWETRWLLWALSVQDPHSQLRYSTRLVTAASLFMYPNQECVEI